MKTSKIVLSVLLALLFSACMEEGDIKVRNEVHNSRLENISFGEVSVYDVLLPGETSEKVEVSDYKKTFPKKHQLEFYMTSNGKTVYLKTKAYYSLDYDETLVIKITDSTEVVNPSVD